MRKSLIALLIASCFGSASAKETLEVTKNNIKFALTATASNPKYLYIVMPGGHGQLGLTQANDKIENQVPFNFLIRTRDLMADEDIVVAAADATDNPDIISSIIAHVKERFPNVQTYIAGTSRSVENTKSLAKTMDQTIAGFVHTASHNSIASFDTRQFKSRHLLAHHEYDGCDGYNSYGSDYNAKKFGTELIMIKGGYSKGNVCGGNSHHGFLGVEQEVIAKIKAWIKR